MLMLFSAFPGTNSVQHEFVPSEIRSVGLGIGFGESAANGPVPVLSKYPIGHTITHGSLDGHAVTWPAGTYPVGQVSATSKVCSGANIKSAGHSAAIAWCAYKIITKMKIRRDILNEAIKE